eukprot:1837043-Prymnesium_polylepis.1
MASATSQTTAGPGVGMQVCSTWAVTTGSSSHAAFASALASPFASALASPFASPLASPFASPLAVPFPSAVAVPLVAPLPPPSAESFVCMCGAERSKRCCLRSRRARGHTCDPGRAPSAIASLRRVTSLCSGSPPTSGWTACETSRNSSGWGKLRGLGGWL